MPARLMALAWLFFFFNDTATTEIYTLSLHDALPICGRLEDEKAVPRGGCAEGTEGSLSRDDSRKGGCARPAQEADGRSRTIRRLQDQDGAAAAGRRVRIRQRHFRRVDSQELYCTGRKGNQGRRRARLSRGISGRGFSRDSLRRVLSRRRFERSLIPDGGPHRL